MGQFVGSLVWDHAREMAVFEYDSRFRHNGLEQQSNGLNGAHYQNLLLRIKKIREKYESGKSL